MEKISFIIPVHNGQEHIVSCINSVLAVKRKAGYDIEIIVLDDGSYDDTGKVCDRITSENDCVIILHQTNTGVSATRNIGIKISSGDYIVFIDSDDKIDAENMIKCICAAEKSRADMLIYGCCFSYYHKKRCYQRDNLLPPFEGVKTLDDVKKAIDECYRANCLSTACNKIIKKEIIVQNKVYFDEEMFLYEDLDFSLRVLAHCASIQFCKIVVYHYRHFEDHLNRIRKLSNIADITDKIENDLNLLGHSSTMIIDSIVSIIRQMKTDAMTFPELKKKYAKRAYKLYLKRIYKTVRRKAGVLIKLHMGDYRKWRVFKKRYQL